MKPVEIAENIYEVGVRDWNIRDFHGYSTHKGTSYNSYLIIDEKIVLIDTVKEHFGEELLENISRIVDPSAIDIVVSNHTEMDHSGSLPRVMHRIGEDKPLYCSKMGKKNLLAHFHRDWNFRVTDGDTPLSIGRRNLHFMETRMLHWPDSMFTFLPDEGILFSSDAFGQHYAGQERFDDEIGDKIDPHAEKYFANILLPFSPLILKLIESVTKKGLEIRMICPDHGIIWRRDPGKIISDYAKWSRQEYPGKKAVIIYDTMWNSTRKMAEAVMEGLMECDILTRLLKLREWDRSDVMTEVMNARAVLVGSPTLNNGMFPTVADFLTYMKGLKPKNKIGGAFGSYGWSGESPGLIRQELEAMKFELPAEPLRVGYVPGRDDIKACREFGKTIGNSIVKIREG